MLEQFTECGSLSLSYSITGLVTVTYSVIHKDPEPQGIETSITVGGQTFKGYVLSTTTSLIPRTNWYETTVVLLATTTAT